MDINVDQQLFLSAFNCPGIFSTKFTKVLKLFRGQFIVNFSLTIPISSPRKPWNQSCYLCYSVYFLCLNVYCSVLYCTVLYCTVLYCTVVLPRFVNPIAVNKYINNNRNIDLNKKSFRGSRVFPCGRTDRHDAVISRFSQFCKCT